MGAGVVKIALEREYDRRSRERWQATFEPAPGLQVLRTLDTFEEAAAWAGRKIAQHAALQELTRLAEELPGGYR